MHSSLNFISTDTLEIHYLDSGPRDAHPVILLHGWPDGASTWADAISELNAAGLRTIAPFLRGFGPTRFLQADAQRSAQIAALAQDVLDLADALGLDRFSVVGHDWGARTAYLLSAIAADRIRRSVSLSVGYGGGALSFRQQQLFWYQWFFAHPEGEQTLRRDRAALCRNLWRSWSPSWQFLDKDFNDAAAGFDNADWIGITLHGYRHRWGLADGDPAYAEWQQVQARIPQITVPTLLIHGEEDGCIGVESSEQSDRHFDGPYQRLVLPGVGHFPQREAAAATAAHIRHWLTCNVNDLPQGAHS